MKTSWKQWVFSKGERLLWRRKTPLLVKEMAFQAVRFAVKCGRSNPISFALRPLMFHQQIKRWIGLNLVVLAVVASIFGTSNSRALDTGGVSTVVIPVGEIQLTTQEAIKNPVSVIDVSQRFWLFHPGIDFRVPTGTKINPVMMGTVSQIEIGKSGYGQKIEVEHKNGYTSLYAHLSKIEVQVGDKVTTDTQIGLSGNTGRSTGPHLHLEIRDETGRLVNPATILGIK